MKRCFIFVYLWLAFPFSYVLAEGEGARRNLGDKHYLQSMDALKYIPVQDQGRVKPYDTFARELLSLVYGRVKYEGKPAFEIVFTWLLTPEAWFNKKIFRLPHAGVKKALRLNPEETLFSFREITASDRLSLLFSELASRREAKEKLNPYYQAVQTLEFQLSSFQSMSSGQLLAVFPPLAEQPESEKSDSESMGVNSIKDRWFAVADLPLEVRPLFLNLTKTFSIIIHQRINSKDRSEVDFFKKLNQEVNSFMELARKANPAVYPSEKMIKWEVHYNEFNPFRIAWVLYLLAALIYLGAFLVKDPVWWHRFSGLSMFCAFALQTYGFLLRMYLTSRPPVSNMYETVVWVSWGAVVFAFIIQALYKMRFVLPIGSLVAAFCMILADNSPSILDPTLQPLEPVLRSNYWLTIHVLTITISYSAYFLAFGLGSFGLSYYLRGEGRFKNEIAQVSQAIYRAIQFGTVFLAAGTILGGVWADESWGRFWGWDPKETWAFIALMGYLAVLHARLSGWVKHYGLMVSSVCAFSLVVMAWYGVNYVLGAGLHSYGFGAGGVEYVTSFIVIHFIYVGYVHVMKKP